MTRPYIPLLAFLVLLLVTIPFSFYFPTSVVPGWHTTIYPPYFIYGLILLLALLFGTIGYWLLLKRVDKINWILFSIHFLLTITTIIFLKFPSIFLNVQHLSQDNSFKAISLRLKLIPVAWIVFFVGQVLFLVYYIRTIKATISYSKEN